MNYQFKIQYHHTEVLDRAKKYLEKREKNGTTGEAEDRIMEQAGWRLVNSKFDIKELTALLAFAPMRPLEVTIGGQGVSAAFPEST
jgi:hypothetical protein